MLTKPIQEKRAVVNDLADQAASELKYLQRKQSMGLAVNADKQTVKTMYKSGVGKMPPQAQKSEMHTLFAGNPSARNAPSYWLEFYDKMHRPGYVLLNLWKAWLKDAGTSYSLCFWDWLIKTKQTVNDKRPARSNESGPGGPAEITQNVRYLNSYERHDYIIRAVGGNTCGLTDHNGTAYDTEPESTEFSGEGWAIFVMDQKDVIYAGTHVLGIFHHSSFLAGAPVKSAGEMIVTTGVLRVLTGKSGHYKPGPEETRRMLAVLIAKNCVAKTAVVKPFQQPWCNAIQWYNAGPTGTVTPATRAEVLSQIPASAQSKIFSLELPPPELARALQGGIPGVGNRAWLSVPGPFPRALPPVRGSSDAGPPGIGDPPAGAATVPRYPAPSRPARRPPP